MWTTDQVCLFDAPFSAPSYVQFIETKPGRHVCAGQTKHVVDLDLTVARAGPCDGGAGRAADPCPGPEVGEHTPVP